MSLNSNNQSVKSEEPLLGKQIPEGQKVPYRFSKMRWLALFLMNLLLLGGGYCYDNPQALETQLVSTLGISDYQFNLLYSIIALPGIVLPVFGGYICDFFGVRRSLMVFQTMITIGQAVFAYGAYTSNYAWMLIGRLIYGIGTDAQNVAQNAMASLWFQGSEQAFAISLATTVYGLGCVIDTFVTPRLQEYAGNLYTPVLFGLILCVVSQISSIAMFWMDYENEKREMACFGTAITAISVDRIKLRDLKNFRRVFWCMALCYGLAGSVFFTFTNIANDFISKRFGFDNIAAGDVLSSLYISMIFAAPVFGLYADKLAQRMRTVTASLILGVVIWVLFGFLPGCSQCFTVLIPLIGMGIFLGLFDGGMYGGIPLVVDNKQLATAFGLLTVAENITMTFVPMIVGSIQDDTPNDEFGYYWICIFMIGYSVVTLISVLPIFREDAKLNHLLDKYKPGMDIVPFLGEGSQKALDMAESNNVAIASARSTLQ